VKQPIVKRAAQTLSNIVVQSHAQALCCLSDTNWARRWPNIQEKKNVGDKEVPSMDQLDPKDTGRGGRIMIDTETGQVRSGEEMDERAERYEQDNLGRKESSAEFPVA
jgi:hypothetical protein